MSNVLQGLRTGFSRHVILLHSTLPVDLDTSLTDIFTVSPSYPYSPVIIFFLRKT